MDPQATWEMLLAAWTDHDWDQLIDSAEALLNWMSRGGCSPDAFDGRRMGSLWNEMIVRSACQFAIDLANKVLADPNGIPDGIPFSLSCYDCDVGSPGSFSEAIQEGWTRIEFHPDSVAENFLGSCPLHGE